jgi:hypothetical protein
MQRDGKADTHRSKNILHGGVRSSVTHAHCWYCEYNGGVLPSFYWAERVILTSLPPPGTSSVRGQEKWRGPYNWFVLLNLVCQGRLRVCENNVLRRTFGPKSLVVTGGWKLCNEELQNSYSSPRIGVYKSRRRWTGHVAGMGEMINAHMNLVGKPEGKRQLRRPRRKWKDNIKMIVKEIGCGLDSSSSV